MEQNKEPEIYQMIFNKCTRTIPRGKNSHFNKWVGELDIYMQKNEVGPLHLQKLTKNGSKT